MSIAKQGDTVKVHYVGTLNDGTQFDSSEGREPLEFSVGAGQVIKGFDESVTGMNIGDTKDVNIAPEEAYGPRMEELVISFPKERFPEGMELTPGAQIYLQDQQANPVPVTIVEVKEEEVLLDANHQLAGQELNFKITLVEII